MANLKPSNPPKKLQWLITPTNVCRRSIRPGPCFFSVIRAYHAVFAFSISCVNKSGENVVIRRRRGRGLGRDELFVEVDMVGDNVDLCDLQDHLDIAKRVRLH